MYLLIPLFIKNIFNTKRNQLYLHFLHTFPYNIINFYKEKILILIFNFLKQAVITEEDKFNRVHGPFISSNNDVVAFQFTHAEG